MRHKWVIIIACGLLAAAAALTAVLARSTSSPQTPTRVASLRSASRRGICSKAKGGCVSGCLLPVAAAIVSTRGRAGECPPATRSSHPCRLLIASEQRTPTTADGSFCPSNEIVRRTLRKERAKPSPRARR
jgi:hypothetical protein